MNTQLDDGLQMMRDYTNVLSFIENSDSKDDFLTIRSKINSYKQKYRLTKNYGHYHFHLLVMDYNLKKFEKKFVN